MSFIQEFDQHGAWRKQFALRLKLLSEWLTDHEMMEPGIRERLDQLHAQVKNDKITVAFVAEFSRGKSELINAVFFAGYGRRIMPASAGRTTMCPTELGFDADVAHQLGPALHIATHQGAGLLGIECQGLATRLAEVVLQIRLRDHFGQLTAQALLHIGGCLFGHEIAKPRLQVQLCHTAFQNGGDIRVHRVALGTRNRQGLHGARIHLHAGRGRQIEEQVNAPAQ